MHLTSSVARMRIVPMKRSKTYTLKYKKKPELPTEVEVVKREMSTTSLYN